MSQIQVQNPVVAMGPNVVTLVAGDVGGGVAAVPGGGSGQLLPSTSLYVGDLDPSVTDTQLYDYFNRVGQVVSVRVCKDASTRRSLGYGYVNYSGPQDALRAMEMLNFTLFNGKTIRIMFSHRDPSIRKSGNANIFIKNLDKSIDNKSLHDTFSIFGNILSCKIATDNNSQSCGYGFVQYDNEESAQIAIEKLNGMLINDKQVYVGPFLRKHERESSTNKTKFNNVYVKNLSESTTDEDLKNIFGEFGSITSAVVMRDADGKSKCFGFVNFENLDDAPKAVEALNGKTFDDKEWYVGKAQKKFEREQELKSRFEQSVKEAVDKYQGLNLYVKNLDDSIDDDKLRDLFTEFGTITSCKVMRDPSGISKGSGFVSFTTADEASKALNGMNGKMLISKPLYVAVAERKEERRARLQMQFAHMRPVPMAPPPALAAAPRMPMYPPGSPAIGGQPLFYGQAPHPMMPPQAGFGYQQQLVPGMRPGSGPIQNFFMPMVQPGQQGPRPGGRRGPVPVQQSQQPMMLMQQQMVPRARMFRYPGGRGGVVPDVPMAGVGGGMVPRDAPIGVGGMVPRDAPSGGGGGGMVPRDAPSGGGGGGMVPRDAPIAQPMQYSAIVSALANSNLEQQRTMLGENLYPLVDQLEHDHAAKVTGMLLEMDQTEVLHLLESPDALKAKVDEAMDVLRNVHVNNSAHQLGSLSLNDNNLVS